MTLPRHPLVLALRPIAEALGATVLPVGEREASDIPLVWDGAVIAWRS